MVLETVAAIGLASSVITFVEFTTRVASKGKEYYASTDGILKEHKDLLLLLQSFERLSDGMVTSFHGIPPQERLVREQKALVAAACNCQRIAVEFKEALATLVAGYPDRKWDCLRHALKTVWSKQSLDRRLANLRLAREDLIVHLLVVIR